MLLEFYGEECSHCIAMRPLVEQLEKEEHVSVTRYETWHNEDNVKTMQEYDKGLCGGVPFFFNTETGKHICGETDYAGLKEWALGK